MLLIPDARPYLHGGEDEIAGKTWRETYGGDIFLRENVEEKT